MFAQFGREPVEQFGVRRLLAHLAEVVRRADEAAAEVPLPDAVGDHSPGERVVGSREPLRQRRAAFALGVRLRQVELAAQLRQARRPRPGSPASPGLRMSPRFSMWTSRGIAPACGCRPAVKFGAAA